ncbi:glycerophosphodiester phosphodiesterase [Halosimplex rubrum]|uniref:Glycerophosphodiester phosphodiesterase n=1 Tax=Halosimplex rubrum TaxID=869889 RepID=A0A7D5TEQ7_9EURY|nr:glycerophosphodiester phosphodiesterase [Halosimplex rubrum]QLH79676.1 glycerophosphodiester phosphodiesterase [Halosimplex rubrum]
MKLIGHRGFADIFPGNSEIAFQNIPKHANMAELDLRRCQSGEVVVLHDGIVDATDSSGRLDEFSADELANLNVHESGQGVPTLSRVLEIIPSNVGLNLDVKEVGLAEDVAEAVQDWDAQVVISSAYKEVLQEVRSVDPDIPTALIFAINPEKNLKEAEKLGCTHVQPHWVISLSTNLIEKAHEDDMGVFIWTVNTDVGAQICRKLGADGMISDRPISVDQLPSPSTQRGEIFEQAIFRKFGVLLLPIALRSVMYPFVRIGACIPTSVEKFGTILINDFGSRRTGYILTKGISAAIFNPTTLLRTGKSWTIANNGRWREASILRPVRRFQSWMRKRGTPPVQYTDTELATKGNKIWNRIQNTVLLAYESVTDRLHNDSLSRSTTTGWWEQ